MIDHNVQKTCNESDMAKYSAVDLLSCSTESLVVVPYNDVMPRVICSRPA